MKLNNKGFAISTLIYGLSVMGMMLVAIVMGIMSVNRANNRTLSNEIEEDLNRFSRTSTTFASSSAGQEFTVPMGETGWYKIELWGAGGGSGTGGLGAYTSGVIELEEEDKIYFYVGSTGTSGGSTDVRLIPNGGGSAAEIQKSYDSRIMVAAGGGQSAGADGGTLKGYNSSMVSRDGIINQDSASDFGLMPGITNLVNYPTNYAPSNENTSFIKRTPIAQSGGGSGYNSGKIASVGGVSFIAGYAGCNGFDFVSGATWNNPGVNSYVEVYDEETNTNKNVPKNFYFIDGLMISGVNKGAGRAKIERIVRKTNPEQKLVRVNKKLNGVTTITDCVDDASYSGNSTKIAAIYQGRDLAGTKTVSGKCLTVSVNQVNGRAPDLDEIGVWHPAGKDYINHTIMINNSTSKMIKAKGPSGVTLSETETPAGYHVSAYQPDMTTSLPISGNYYIMPVITENKTLTAQQDSDNEFNPIKVAYINGYKSQKWNIQLITNPKVSPGYVAGTASTYEYKITELARFRALNILNDENKIRNKVGAALEFNSKKRNEPQIWKVKPMGNGTYVITTIVPKFSKNYNTGNIYANTVPTPQGNKEVLIGKINDNIQRYKLISVDYSSA